MPTHSSIPKDNHIWSGLSEDLNLDVAIYLLDSNKVDITFISFIEGWLQRVIVPRESVSINGRLDACMILRFIERAYLTDVMVTKPSTETLH